jgi:AcrR family transcriptional regulator
VSEPAATATATPPRRRRTREQTEADILSAALQLLARDGVLAGITLREVAKAAGVNHGQIYLYFGTRQALLRAAITRLVEQNLPDPALRWNQPFAKRRRVIWDWALSVPEFVKLEALLALDGDPELTMFRDLDLAKQALERDTETGGLPADADALVMHAMTAVTSFGYCIFRSAIARELEITPVELDQRAGVVYDRMLSGLTAGERPPAHAPAARDPEGEKRTRPRSRR